MEERAYTVLLTEKQEIKLLECDPQEDLFELARGAIGCDWIELVEADALNQKNCVLLIDEEGKLRDKPAGINCVASDLYGSDQHGDPIVGSAIVVHTDEDRLELLTSGEAKALTAELEANREQSITKISRAFGLRRPKERNPDRRQPCKTNGMER